MTKKSTIMVGLAGVFPLVNVDNNSRIDTGPAVEVELTPWVESQLAAGSLVKFNSAGEPELNAEAKAAVAQAEALAQAAAAAEEKAAEEKSAEEKAALHRPKR